MKGIEVKIYINESAKKGGENIFESIIHLANEHDIMTANVSRCILGYSKEEQIHSEKFLQLSRDLPLKVELTDKKEKIEKILPELKELASQGIITTRDVEII